MNKKIFSITNLFLFSLLFIVISNAQPFDPPEWCYDKTIYEVNIRQYSEAGNFKEFEKHLPRLKEMGVGILWLMPIHPIGKLNRKGTLGSYYSVKDYKAVNPEFGTLEDFKSLVEKIHEMGMYVIIDWIANHTAWDNEWMTTHPEFYTKDSLGNVIPPVPDWQDVADLNYDNQELRKEMIDALKFWVKECDIDGYRCDVAGMVPIDFWIDARTELEKIKKVFMLAEWDTPEIHEAFDMSYDWNMYKLLNGIAKGERSANDLAKLIKMNEMRFPSDAFKMQFTSNHDENTWNGTAFDRLEDAAEISAMFTFMIPDMPLIYSGQEAGNKKRLEFFDRDPIEWKQAKFESLYASLILLKQTNESLLCGNKGGAINFLFTNPDSCTLAFTREQNEDKVIALFNFSKDIRNIKIDDENISGNYLDYFSGEPKTFMKHEIFSMKPWEYRIFVK